MQQLRIAFIGGGNMAEALIGGLLRVGHPATHVTVSEPQAARRQLLAERYAVRLSEDNVAAVQDADLVLLAVKPQQLRGVLQEIAAALPAACTVISIAAGVASASLQAWSAGHPHIVRVMPNTAALVGAGMSVLYSEADELHQQRAEYLLNACGQSTRVTDESLMHVVTALSGSGPAYFFLLAELMQAAGVKLGLDASLASTLVGQTALGAGKMLVESGRDAESLRHQVTSPGGTTQAALDMMYEMGFPAAVREGVVAAKKRSEEMS